MAAAVGAPVSAALLITLLLVHLTADSHRAVHHGAQ
jgi:hypothetical protein